MKLQLHEEIVLQNSHSIPNYSEVYLSKEIIVIAPFNSHLLLFYSLGGELLREVNQYGAGPGDFGSNVISMNYSEDELYIHDGRNARYTVIPVDDLAEDQYLYKHISTGNVNEINFGKIINVVDSTLFVAMNHRSSEGNEIPFKWKPSHERRFEYEMRDAYLDNPEARNYLKNYLENAIENRQEDLSWFHDVLVRGESIWYSLMRIRF